MDVRGGVETIHSPFLSSQPVAVLNRSFKTLTHIYLTLGLTELPGGHQAEYA
jgi:hypothetical protein